jgi:hypothetical protein
LFCSAVIHRGGKGDIYEGGTRVPALIYHARYIYIYVCIFCRAIVYIALHGILFNCSTKTPKVVDFAVAKVTAYCNFIVM